MPIIKLNIKNLRLIFLLLMTLLCIDMALPDSCSSVKGIGTDSEKTSCKNTDKRNALHFLESLSKNPAEKIKHIKVSYDIHFQREWKVNLKMSAYVEMRKHSNGYLSSFRISRPVGADLWGKFAMLVYGSHTEEYRQAVEEMESTVIEKFSFENGRFLTDSVIEILPEKRKSTGMHGFRISFDRKKKLVKFWENSAVDNKSTSIKYDKQQGPLSAFFNYILFEKPCTEFTCINIQRHNEENAKEKVGISPSIVSQKIKVGKNNTGSHGEYPYVVFLMRDNFFDIVYGKYIYYNISLRPESTLKVPFSALVKGIINKSRYRERTKKLERIKKKRYPHKKLEKKLKEIESINILSAKNVKVRFESAEVSF